MPMYNSCRPSMIASTDMREHKNQISVWLWIDGRRVPFYEEFDIGGRFTGKLLGALHLDYADSTGRFIYTLPMQWHVVDTNHGAMMHAGATASLFLICGNNAVTSMLATFRAFKTGNIEIEYLARERFFGNQAEVEAEVMHFGRKLATTEVRIKDKASRILLAKGTLTTHLARPKTPPPVYKQNIQKHPWKFKVTYKSFKNVMGKSSMETNLWDLSQDHLESHEKYLPEPERKMIKKLIQREHRCPLCEIRVGDRAAIRNLENLGMARPSMLEYQLKLLARRDSKYCPNNRPEANQAFPLREKHKIGIRASRMI